MKRLGFLLMLGACWGGESPVAPERVPLGVLSRDATRIFVTGADGGIEALEASTGKRIWFSPAALRPLMDVGGKLIAWVPEMGKPNVLRIATLSAADGKTLELSSPIPLPEWACLNREKPAHLFEMEAVLLGNASLRVSWRADAWPPPEAVGLPPAQEAWRTASGSLLMDPASGKILETKGDAPAPEKPRLPDALARLAFSRYERWEERDPMLSSLEEHPTTPEPGWIGTPWISGGIAAAVEIQESGRGTGDEPAYAVTLRSWDLGTGKERPAREIFHGEYGHRTVVFSEGLCLGVRRKAPPGTGNLGTWTLYVTETGRPLATIRELDSAADPVVVVSARELLVLDLTREKEEEILRLRRWDRLTWQEGPAVTLMTGKGLKPYTRGGGRYACVIDGAKGQVSVFSLEDGHRLACLDQKGRIQEIRLAGGLLYCLGMENESSRVLKVVDPACGRLLWERAVEPFRYHCPKP